MISLTRTDQGVTVGARQGRSRACAAYHSSTGSVKAGGIASYLTRERGWPLPVTGRGHPLPGSAMGYPTAEAVPGPSLAAPPPEGGAPPICWSLAAATAPTGVAS